MAPDTHRPSRRTARFAAAAALVVASVAFSLVVGEGVLRLIDFSYPAFHVPDDLAGMRLRPGAHGWYREEGATYISINSDGWRDIERPKAKPPGVVRIAVLGDSFIEAIQVARQDTFPARLQEELASCEAFGNRPVEVLNFGVSSYGTAQELLTLRRRASEYSPDVVVLAFLPSNDVRNNSSTLEDWKARPFFELKGGELIPDNSFRDDPGFKRRKQRTEDTAFLLDLRLHQLTRKVRDGRYQGWNDAPTLAIGHAPVLREPGIADRALVPPKDGAWEEAWKLTDRLVEAVHAEARSLGARFVLVVLTTGGSVYPDA
jgi:lysophospholipase L1-like esterase